MLGREEGSMEAADECCGSVSFVSADFPEGDGVEGDVGFSREEEGEYLCCFVEYSGSIFFFTVGKIPQAERNKKEKLRNQRVIFFENITVFIIITESFR